MRSAAKKRIGLLIGTALVLCTGLVVCTAFWNQQAQPSNDDAVSRAGAKQISKASLGRIEKADGHKVYVPVYSHVYQMEDHVFNLTSTLSIRNTDDDADLFVVSVTYYDTKGNLIRNYIEEPVQLPPLATLEYIVGETDTAGGSGANFIVEWMSGAAIAEPVIECVMIGTQSQQGISFISAGRVIE